MGWLHPKNSAIITQSIAQFNDQTKIPANLLTSKDYPVTEAKEVQQLRGILGDYGKLLVQKPPDAPIQAPTFKNRFAVMLYNIALKLG